MKAATGLRQHARVIFDAGLKAADPGEAILKSVRLNGAALEIDGRSYPVDRYRFVYVVGAGKGAAKMAGALEQILGDRIRAGLVIVKYGYSLPARRVAIFEAGHPIPDQNGIAATKQLIRLLETATGEDLVLSLISGGGSALLTCPFEGLSLQDKQETTQLLLKCGAPIQEINAIRKHMSKVKGGRLAQIAHPSTLISLILSDVVGDAVETIASGPTAPDPTTFSDCQRVIDHYGLRNKIPCSLASLLEKGSRGDVEETPKPGAPIFAKVRNRVIGNNRLAIRAAKRQAETLGYRVVLMDEVAEGEAAELAARHTAMAKEIVNLASPIARPACIISGGEATVTVRGDGLGGRNQEFALAAALEIQGFDNIVALSGGTDGTDGPTDAAGGIVDGGTVQRGKDRGLDARQYLRANDSYHFLRSTHDLLITGPTFTNVMDLRVILIR